MRESELWWWWRWRVFGEVGGGGGDCWLVVGGWPVRSFEVLALLRFVGDRKARTHARTHTEYIHTITYIQQQGQGTYCTTVCRVCVHVHCRVFTWYICMDVMYSSKDIMYVSMYSPYVWISKYMYGQQQAAARRMTRRQKGRKAEGGQTTANHRSTTANNGQGPREG